MIKQYVKKPVVVEAVQYTGDNGDEVIAFFKDAINPTIVNNHFKVITIQTNKGLMVAEVGDFIIKDSDGKHYYPCKPDIFEKTYEEIIQ